MVLANAIDKYKIDAVHPVQQELLNQAIETLVLLLSPFAPHVAEEMWQMMGKNDITLARVPWPHFDEDALKTSTIVMAVQVNGRVRGQIKAAPASPRRNCVEYVWLILVLPNMQKKLTSKNSS